MANGQPETLGVTLGSLAMAAMNIDPACLRQLREAMDITVNSKASHKSTLQQGSAFRTIQTGKTSVGWGRNATLPQH
jgi:hypothetical protein